MSSRSDELQPQNSWLFASQGALDPFPFASISSSRVRGKYFWFPREIVMADVCPVPRVHVPRPLPTPGTAVDTGSQKEAPTTVIVSGTSPRVGSLQHSLLSSTWARLGLTQASKVTFTASVSRSLSKLAFVSLDGCRQACRDPWKLLPSGLPQQSELPPRLSPACHLAEHR